MQIDPRLVFLILVFAAAFSLVQAIWGLARVAQTRRQVNHRLLLQQRTSSISDLVVELRKQRGLNAAGERGRGLAWLSELITISGVAYQPRRWALMLAGVALGAGAAVFVFTRNPLFAAAAVGFTAVIAPIAFLKFMAARRAKALGMQLPQALEIVVRSLEAGHPVATAIALVGREMADPVGSEFGMAADEIAFGATLAQAVGRIGERCRHPDIDLFAATVRLQERSGGNLVGLLKMNAQTVRERFKMRLKIKAASAEGRMSALILTAAPILVFVALQFMSPSFYGSVIHERGIQIGLGACVAWIAIGNVIMRRMIDMRL